MEGDKIRVGLRRVPIKTLSSRLKPFLPLIEERLAEGARIRDVLNVLSENGLVLSEALLRYNLKKYGSEKAGKDGNKGKESKGENRTRQNETAGRTERPANVAATGESNKPDTAADADVPLTRARLREIRSRPFNWETMNQGGGAEGNDE